MNNLKIKEALTSSKKHLIESFEEFFTEDLIEKVLVWVMLIFTVAFGSAAVVVPILLHTNYEVSGLVFLSYIVTVPIEMVLIGASANWVVKVWR